MPAIPKHSKITASDVGSPGGIFFQAVCDWADGEAARLYSGNDLVFDLKGGDLMSKEEMIMLQRSVYHVADSKEIRFQQGPNSHDNLLAKLRHSRPEIDSGVDERFRDPIRESKRARFGSGNQNRLPNTSRLKLKNTVQSFCWLVDFQRQIL